MGQSNFSSPTIGVGVVVKDLQAAKHFYIDIIGMEETGGFSLDEDFTRRSGLSGGVPFSVSILKLEDSPQATEWKLMTFPDLKTKKKKKRKTPFIQDQVGAQYITIRVNDLQPILKKIQEEGVLLLGRTPIHLQGEDHFVLVQDPDGTFVELIGPIK